MPYILFLFLTIGCASKQIEKKPQTPQEMAAAAEKAGIEQKFFDWNKVKTVGDMKEILSRIYPHLNILLKKDSVEDQKTRDKIKHLFKEEVKK